MAVMLVVHEKVVKLMLRPFLTRNIFDKYLGCLGPKKLSKIFLENIIWEMWEASYGSEIFFSLFDGGM